MVEKDGRDGVRAKWVGKKGQKRRIEKYNAEEPNTGKRVLPYKRYIR